MRGIFVPRIDESRYDRLLVISGGALVYERAIADADLAQIGPAMAGH
ncbi:hypothetical protein VB712_13540 [Spirulina sp. CCNP1310]|nr:hypothetical protein [Spirulina sp. CCNP1310]MEA5420248.1 hypothetical protein [Spirulina sp. CCNP1310]